MIVRLIAQQVTSRVITGIRTIVKKDMIILACCQYSPSIIVLYHLSSIDSSIVIRVKMIKNFKRYFIFEIFVNSNILKKLISQSKI